MSARWRCWTDMRMLDWDTVALLDQRQLDERTLAVLDGRESAGLGYGGFAGRMSSAGLAGEDTAVLLDGTQLDERRMGGRVLEWNTVVLLDG